MSFIGSSELWGDQSVARLCQVIMESNDGMVQQLLSDRTDWLDLLSKEELERTDDLGLSLSYLAVYYDKPEAIKYLHKRGIDLGKPCDPVEFGHPMYYAITLGKLRIVEILHKLGYSLVTPCETIFQKNAVYYAERKDDQYLLQCIESIRQYERKAYHLLRKNYLKSKYRKQFLKKKKACIKIQKIIRGKLARILYISMKYGDDRDGGGEDDLNQPSSSMIDSSQRDISTLLEEGEDDGNLEEGSNEVR